MLPLSAQNVAMLKNYRNQVILNKCRSRIIQHNNFVRNMNNVKHDDIVNNNDENVWSVITSDIKWTVIAVDKTGDYLYGVSDQGIYLVNKSNEIIETTAPKELLWTCISTNRQNIVASAFKENSFLLYTSNDYGNTWTNTFTCIGQGYCSSIKCCQLGKNFIVKTIMGFIYTSNDYGITWSTNINLGTKTYSMTMDCLGKYIAISSFDGIYISNDYGSSFNKNTFIQKLIHVNMDTTGQFIVASTSTGTIYKSNDYGDTWFIIGDIKCCPKSLTCDKEARKIVVTSIYKTQLWVFVSDDDILYTSKSETTSGVFTQVVCDNIGKLTAIVYENNKTFLTKNS